MIRIIGGFGGNFKKKFENTIDKFTEKAKQRKIAELHSKGLYKSGITKIVVKFKDSGGKWTKAFTNK